MNQQPLVAFADSRDLHPVYRLQVYDILRIVVRARRQVITGCARGLDQMVRELYPGATVLYAKHFPGDWPQKLRSRTVTMVEQVARARTLSPGKGSGVIAFFARPDSSGTLLACKTAARFGLPVLAFPCSTERDEPPFDPQLLPPSGPASGGPSPRTGPGPGPSSGSQSNSPKG